MLYASFSLVLLVFCANAVSNYWHSRCVPNHQAQGGQTQITHSHYQVEGGMVANFNRMKNNLSALLLGVAFLPPLMFAIVSLFFMSICGYASSKLGNSASDVTV
jgi:hypothetical protein